MPLIGRPSVIRRPLRAGARAAEAETSQLMPRGETIGDGQPATGNFLPPAAVLYAHDTRSLAVVGGWMRAARAGLFTFPSAAGCFFMTT